MREELVRRNYAQTTIRTYLMAIEEFRRQARKRLDHLGPEDIRRYQVGLLESKKLAVGTVALRVSAVRFFYLKVLKKRALKDELPYPKHPKWARRLPTILTPEEMTRLITANWRAPANNKWLVPFGGGFGKMTRFFSQPMT